MRIKYFAFTFLATLLSALSSCHKDSFSPTMSATVDGEDWIAAFTTYSRGNGEWDYVGLSDSLRIEIHLKSISQGTFVMDSVNGAFIDYYKASKLYQPAEGTGTFTIGSAKNGVVSGTFDIIGINAVDGDSAIISEGVFNGFPGD